MGHRHINQMTSLFKILDKILLEELGKEVFNFKSPKSYCYFISASYMHKSFQAIQILLHGIKSKICYEYSSHCWNNVSITPEGKWLVNHESRAIAMVNQLFLNYVLATYIQKGGKHHENHKFISTSRYKFIPMFFCF